MASGDKFEELYESTNISRYNERDDERDTYLYGELSKTSGGIETSQVLGSPQELD